MSTFKNTSTQVVVTVADEKDDRFADGWERVSDEKPAPKSRSKKSD